MEAINEIIHGLGFWLALSIFSFGAATGISLWEFMMWLAARGVDGGRHI